MAHFKSVVTDIGAEKIAAIVAGGGKLSLRRWAAAAPIPTGRLWLS